MIAKLRIGLIIEVIIATILATLMYYVVGFNNSLYLLTAPFDLIGKGLRILSLSSFLGNKIAILLYGVIALLPVIILLRKSSSKFKKSHLLLLFLSIYNFYMLYQFINPILMMNRLPKEIKDVSTLPMLKMSLAVIFYVLCFSYLMVQLLENLQKDNMPRGFGFLCNKLQIILTVVSMIYTFVLGYFKTFDVFKAYDTYLNQNISPMNGVFILLTYILEGIPVVLSIMILLSGIHLLQAMTTNHLQEDEIKAAKQLGSISKITVYITVICNLLLNVLQLLFSKDLVNTDYTIRISFIPLVIAFAAVILSGYFKEAKELQEDNDMFI